MYALPVACYYVPSGTDRLPALYELDNATNDLFFFSARYVASLSMRATVSGLSCKGGETRLGGTRMPVVEITTSSWNTLGMFVVHSRRLDDQAIRQSAG